MSLSLSLSIHFLSIDFYAPVYKLLQVDVYFYIKVNSSVIDWHQISVAVSVHKDFETLNNDVYLLSWSCSVS